MTDRAVVARCKRGNDQAMFFMRRRAAASRRRPWTSPRSCAAMPAQRPGIESSAPPSPCGAPPFALFPPAGGASTRSLWSCDMRRVIPSSRPLALRLPARPASGQRRSVFARAGSIAGALVPRPAGRAAAPDACPLVLIFRLVSHPSPGLGRRQPSPRRCRAVPAHGRWWRRSNRHRGRRLPR